MLNAISVNQISSKEESNKTVTPTVVTQEPNIFEAENKQEHEIIKTFHGKDNIFSDAHSNVPKIINLIDKDAKDAKYAGDTHGVYVKYDKLTKTFLFKDSRQNYIGSFGANHIVKYVGSPYDLKNQFMTNIDNTSYNNAKNVIKNFVGCIKVNPKLKYVNIILLDYQTSPFMGDMELLMQLYSDLYDFETQELTRELMYVDEKFRTRVASIIEKFIYVLGSYILQLIAVTSDHIKNDASKDKIKSELIKFSIGLVYRISQYVQSQILILHKENESLNNLLDKTIKAREHTDKKLEAINVLLTAQNARMDERNAKKENNTIQDELLERLENVEKHVLSIQPANEINNTSSSYSLKEYGNDPVDASNYDIFHSPITITDS